MPQAPASLHPPRRFSYSRALDLEGNVPGRSKPGNRQRPKLN